MLSSNKLNMFQALESRREMILLIREAIQNRKANPNACSNVLDTMMAGEDYNSHLKESTLTSKDQPQRDTEPEFMDMILELLVGSQSTLASACCALMVHLALHPEVVDTIRKELAQNQYSCCNGNAFTDLLNLTYVNDVVKEVLRVSPPVAGGFRQTKEHLTLAVWIFIIYIFI